MSQNMTAEHHDIDSNRVAAEVRAQLRALHAEARRHWGPPLDLAVVLRDMTQADRFRFRDGGVQCNQYSGDWIDAVVHASEHGFRVCGAPAGTYSRCWMPTGHSGQCGDVWRWRLLYGQPQGDLPLVCSTCTPHRRDPRPATCPHPAQGVTEHGTPVSQAASPGPDGEVA